MEIRNYAILKLDSFKSLRKLTIKQLDSLASFLLGYLEGNFLNIVRIISIQKYGSRNNQIRIREIGGSELDLTTDGFEKILVPAEFYQEEDLSSLIELLITLDKI